MTLEEPILTLSDVIARLELFLGRGVVQVQLLVITVAIAVAWLISKQLWDWLKKKYPRTVKLRWTHKRLLPREYIETLVRDLHFPVISLVLLQLSRNILLFLDWRTGLLTVSTRLLGVYCFYRLFLLFLCVNYPQRYVRQYHLSLFFPLFVFYVLVTFITLYNDLGELSALSPFQLFNHPVTLRDLFSLTVGLYFWIVAIMFIEILILEFYRAKNFLNIGEIEATLTLGRYFLIAVGIIGVLGYVGVDGTALAAISGGLSVGIGFGLQQVIGNFLSGVILLFERALKPGDIIDIEGKLSRIKKLGIRATTVRVLNDNSERIIPNQKFFISDFTTYTGSDRLVCCAIPLEISQDCNVKQVMDILLEIAKQHPEILPEPKPLVFLNNFSKSGLNFQFQFWLDDINLRQKIISDLNFAILETFARENIPLIVP